MVLNVLIIELLHLEGGVTPGMTISGRDASVSSGGRGQLSSISPDSCRHYADNKGLYVCKITRHVGLKCQVSI